MKTIKQIRNEHHITIEKLAKILDRDIRTVYRIQDSVGTKGQQQIIAEYIGVDVNELFDYPTVKITKLGKKGRIDKDKYKNNCLSSYNVKRDKKAGIYFSVNQFKRYKLSYEEYEELYYTGIELVDILYRLQEKYDFDIIRDYFSLSADSTYSRLSMVAIDIAHYDEGILQFDEIIEIQKVLENKPITIGCFPLNPIEIVTFVILKLISNDNFIGNKMSRREIKIQVLIESIADILVFCFYYPLDDN